MKKAISLLLLLMALLVHAPVRADSGCRIKLHRRAAPTNGNSIELEMPITQPLLSTVIDTADGTLGPIFVGHRINGPKLQAELCSEAGIALGPGQEPNALRWRSLAFSRQKALLNAINRRLAKGTVDFFSSRRIPGLVARPGMAKNYPLESYVEYRGPKDLKNWEGVELHLRSEGLPSDNLATARRFTQDLLGTKTNLHIHLTARSRWNASTITDLGAILKHVDFLRRTEMIAHMVSVVDSRIAIAKNMDGSIQNMGVLSGADLRIILEQFSAAALRSMRSPDTFVPVHLHSKNFVGYRTEGAYSDKDLWGIEFRVVTAQGDDPNMKALLDGIQSAMDEANYGAPHSDLLSWLEQEFKQYTESVRQNYKQRVTEQTRYDRILRWFRLKKRLHEPTDIDLVEKFFNDRAYRYIGDQYPLIELDPPSWRRQPGQVSYAELTNWFDASDPTTSVLWRTYLKTKERQFLTQSLKMDWVRYWNGSNRHLSYVIHPWEKDALLKDQPAQVRIIRDARLHAIRELNRGSSTIEVTREFLLRSGIYEIYLGSFGAKLDRTGF